MTLNHLNLTVTDPEETSAFLAKHFGLRDGGGNKGMRLLNDDQGMVLTLFKAGVNDRVGGEGANAAQVRYPSTFHIGFLQSRARARPRDPRAVAGGRRRGGRRRAPCTAAGGSISLRLVASWSR